MYYALNHRKNVNWIQFYVLECNSLFFFFVELKIKSNVNDCCDERKIATHFFFFLFPVVGNKSSNCFCVIVLNASLRREKNAMKAHKIIRSNKIK